MLGRIFIMLATLGHWQISYCQSPKPNPGHAERTQQQTELWIEQIGDDSLAVRRRAYQQILLVGKRAIPMLETRLADSDPEIRIRARELINELTRGPQVRALVELKKLNAKLEFHPDGNLRKVSLERARVEDEHMAMIGMFPTLEELDVRFTNVTNVGLRELRGLSELRVLNIRGTLIDDAGLRYLSQLTKLTSLALEDTTITDVGMVRLRHLKDLEVLYLGGSDVQGSGLRSLKGLPRLRYLSFQFATIQDHGIKHVASLPVLETLGLDDTKVSNACLKDLVNMKNLTVLWLNNSQVDDQGIDDLAKLQNLTELHMKGTKVSHEGGERLKKAMPNCTITGLPEPESKKK